MPAAFTGEEIPCRPKGRPAFRAGPRNRDFSRKKRCYSTRLLAASEIAHRQFRRRSLGCAKIPGWPASGLFCPIAARSLWNILSMPYLPNPAGLRRECACRWRQRKKRPCALQPHEEKQISSQPVRRRRKTLTAFFAWRREIKKRFCRLLGLWPKGGGRTHPRTGCTIPFCGQTSPQACGWLGCRTGDADRRFLWEFRAMRETSPPVTAQPAQYAPNRYIKYAVNGRGTLVQCAEKFSSG